MSKTKNSHYDEQDIDVLKGLEPVRARPGMYTRTENPNHILYEVIDNAQDEALTGFANEILVELHEDNSISVMDNGRGIPTGIHPKEKKPVIEVVFTMLHAGGKFRKGEGKIYKFTGGLHGVGVSVTNALCEKMQVVVYRDGFEHTLTFSKGKIIKKLSKKKLPSKDKNKTGTYIRIWPETKYFDSPNFNLSKLKKYLRSKAVLLKTSRISWKEPNKETSSWYFPGGLTQYLKEQVEELPHKSENNTENNTEYSKDKEDVKTNIQDSLTDISHLKEDTNDNIWITPIFYTSQHYTSTTEDFFEDEGFELSVGWHEQGKKIKESYVNLIPTLDGGRHETGLKAGLLEAFRNIGNRLNVFPKGVRLEHDDILSSMSFVLSVKLLDPQFQNQTKDKMTSERGQRLVSKMLCDAMELWLNENPEYTQILLDQFIQSALNRAKSKKKVKRKNISSNSVLPGKLSDCESEDLDVTELFLVEGDSAGGSSKQGRDRKCQAILPLRGKLLNTWDVDHHRAMLSETIADISSAIGIQPHNVKQINNVDLSKLRYGKIFIMADADVDGQHIQVLLLTLFLKHFPALITNHHIWIARAPLYRIDAPHKKGSKDKTPRKIYILDDNELKSVLSSLKKEGLSEQQYKVSRFKGLGEMNPKQLKETTMNKETRRSLCITLGDAQKAKEAFNRMMCSKNASDRREWMEESGYLVESD